MTNIKFQLNEKALPPVGSLIRIPDFYERHWKSNIAIVLEYKTYDWDPLKHERIWVKYFLHGAVYEYDTANIFNDENPLYEKIQ